MSKNSVSPAVFAYECIVLGLDRGLFPLTPGKGFAEDNLLRSKWYLDFLTVVNVWEECLIFLWIVGLCLSTPSCMAAIESTMRKENVFSPLYLVLVV